MFVYICDDAVQHAEESFHDFTREVKYLLDGYRELIWSMLKYISFYTKLQLMAFDP